MPTITDWLMVGITGVYVIATIFICIFNGKSANATREQVVESKRQFAETNRLQVMPFFEMRIIDTDVQEENKTPCTYITLSEKSEDDAESFSFICLKNLGSGIAHHIRITVTTSYKKDDEYPPRNLVFPPNTEKSTYVHFSIKNPDQNEIGTKADIVVNIYFEDVLGNKYKQEAHFMFVATHYRVGLLSYVETSSPKLIIESENLSNA